jgi:hypothetical protein
MSNVSTAFADGIRFVSLGSAANLLIAAPITDGDPDPAANTDAARIGWYFDRTVSAEKMAAVVLGTESLAIYDSGITALEVRSSGNTLVGDTDASAFLGLARFSGANARIRAGYGADGTQNSTGLVISVRDAGGTDVDAITVDLDGNVSFAASPVVTGLTANRILVSSAASEITTAAALTDGQLLIGSTGVAPVAATLIAGANVTILNGAGTITISSTGGSGSPGGADTNVQYNNAGGFAGAANFAWDNGTNTLTVVGTIVGTTVSGTTITSSGIVNAPLGAVGTPSYTFTGDLDTGIYSPAANQVGVSTSGVLRLTVSDTAITSTLINILPATTAGAASTRLPHGTVPSAPVNGDLWTTSAGLFVRINGLTVGPLAASTGGTPGGLTTQVQYNNAGSFGGSSSFTFNSGSGLVTATTFTSTANLNAGGLVLTSAGTAGAPSFSFTGDPDTGIYNGATNELTFATNGSARMYLNTTLLGLTGGASFLSAGYVQWTSEARAPAGSAGAPSYTFAGDLNTGIYNGTADEITFATNGAARMYLDTTILGLTGGASFLSAGYVQWTTQSRAPGGTVGAPSYSFTSDLATGFYQPSASEVSVSVGGVQISNFSASAITHYALTVFPAATTSAASIRLPHGTAPTVPTNGDMWTTTSGLFARINGSTVGPFGVGGGTPAGANTEVQYNNAGSFGASSAFTFASNQLTVASNTDTTHTFGKVALGYDGASANYACFAHLAQLATSPAVSQNDTGYTTVSCAAGQQVAFAITGTGAIAAVTTDAFRCNFPIVMNGQRIFLGLSTTLASSQQIIRGSGDPEGSYVAPVGSLYLRTDGSTNTTLYIKESGTGNTGWVAK